jgi:hypothetical protein
MVLVETLRLRRWTIGWASVILAVAVIIVLTIQHAITTVEINGSTWGAMNVPLVTFAPLAMFLSMIYASRAGLTLNEEGRTLALSWTKPVSRVVIALRIVMVDVAAIVASNVFAWLVIIGVTSSARGSVAVSADQISTIVLALAVPVMWYGLVVALTAGLPSNGGLIMGFLWPGSLLVSQLRGPFGNVFDTIVLVLNAINPLAYMNLQISSGHNPGIAYWQAPTDARAAIAWLLAAGLIAVGVALWTRREA